MPTKIIKYTGELGEKIEDGNGVVLLDVGPKDRLERVSAELADYLAANDPDYEIYTGPKNVPDDYTAVDGRDIEPDSVTTDSLSTESVVSKFVGGQNIGPVDESAIAQKSTWTWGNINWEHRDTPIITGDELGYAAGYASYMPGKIFDDPIDAHYMAVAGHDNPDTYLATASDFWGEWTIEGSLWSDSESTEETSSPSWVYHPESGKTRLYYHSPISGEGQITRVVEAPTTGDGTNFDSATKQDVIKPPGDYRSWDRRETTYAHIVRDRGGWFAAYQGREQQGRPTGIATATSGDGYNWVRDLNPVADNTMVDSANAEVWGPTIVTLGGAKTIMYRDSQRGGVYAINWDSRHRPHHNGGTKVMGKNPAPWMGSSGDLVIENIHLIDDYLYAIYSGGDVAADKRIGLARAHVTEVFGQ